jgi:hypothetical protein
MALLVKRLARNSIAPGRLAAWLGAADNSHLYTLTTVGTDDIKDKGLRHYAFGNGGNHRVDTIQTVVQHVEALFDALEFLRLAGSGRHGLSSFFHQSDTSYEDYNKLIIWVKSHNVKAPPIIYANCHFEEISLPDHPTPSLFPTPARRVFDPPRNVFQRGLRPL